MPWRIQNFSLPAQNGKEKKIDKGKCFTVVRQIRRDSSDVDSDDNSKIHPVSKVSDSEFYHTTFWINFLTPESINKQYIFEDKKYGILIQLVIQQEWFHHPIFCNKNLDYPVLLKEGEANLLVPFVVFVQQNFLDTVWKGQMMKSGVFTKVIQRIFLLVFINVSMKMLCNYGEKKMTLFSLGKLQPIKGLKSTSFMMQVQEEPEITIN